MLKKEYDLEIINWGRIPYLEAWTKQKEFLEKRQKDLIKDTFIFCEHDAIITVGRGKPKEGELPFIAPSKIPTVEIERGGLATYHGPGQLVCYPIVRLSPEKDTQFPGGILGFIRFLEQWMLRVLNEYDVKARIIDGKTGVWIDSNQGSIQSTQKIASIGIAVSHWVSYHGLAFNFKTGVEAWRSFNPCGLPGDIMTDLDSVIRNKYEEQRSLLTYSSVLEKFLNTLQ